MHGAVTLVVSMVWIFGSIASFFGIIDAIRHTAAQWAAIGQSKILWIVLLIVWLGGGILIILPGYYWLRVSPRLAAASSAAI